jgi:hypothetical protein
MDQQHRWARRVALVEEGELQAVMGKTGKGRGIKVHRGPSFVCMPCSYCPLPAEKTAGMRKSPGARRFCIYTFAVKATMVRARKTAFQEH